jgi:hypothetical protein
MPLDGLIRTDVILGPTQCSLDLLVALFNPHAEAVQTRNLFQAQC